jgi:hypothetical protein
MALRCDEDFVRDQVGKIGMLSPRSLPGPKVRTLIKIELEAIRAKARDKEQAMEAGIAFLVLPEGLGPAIDFPACLQLVACDGDPATENGRGDPTPLFDLNGFNRLEALLNVGQNHKPRSIGKRFHKRRIIEEPDAVDVEA